MHVQSCCFADQTYCFFAVLVAVRVVVLKLSIVTMKERVDNGFQYQNLRKGKPG